MNGNDRIDLMKAFRKGLGLGVRIKKPEPGFRLTCFQNYQALFMGLMNCLATNW